MKKFTLLVAATTLSLSFSAWADDHEGKEHKGHSAEKRAEMFKHMDADGDGKISPEEFNKPRGHHKKKHDRMGHMDADKDGVVSKKEFLADAEKRFKEMDVNGDGKATHEEMKAHHEKMRKHHKEMRKHHKEMDKHHKEGAGKDMPKDPMDGAMMEPSVEAEE